MEPRFRPAAAPDVPALLKMMEELYAEDGGNFDRSPASAALGALIGDPALGGVWLLEDAEGACGYVVLTLGYSLEFHGRDAFVDELFVRPRRRGAGLGAAALSLLEEECRRRGVRALHLEVTPDNRPAVDLYTRHGFTLRERRLMTRPVSARQDAGR
jgi:ribosomal protein S18 acetylase RimI-like enzyme